MCLYCDKCNLYKNFLYQEDYFCKEDYTQCARYTFANEKQREIPDEINTHEHWKINLY